jgi:hypothetical protein
MRQGGESCARAGHSSIRSRPRATPPADASPSGRASSPAPPGSTASSAAPGRELLGVLLRLRALDGAAGGCGRRSLLGGMRLHALDDAGTVLPLPAATSKAAAEALAAAAAAETAAAAARPGGAAAQGAGAAGDAAADGGAAAPATWACVSGRWLGGAEEEALAAGAARLASATQLRLLLPGCLVVGVVLEAPGGAAPLRVKVDCADRCGEGGAARLGSRVLPGGPRVARPPQDSFPPARAPAGQRA